MSETQYIKPLLFMPSIRDIPAVKKLWHTLPYEKFIVKYKSELEAYTEGKEYFTTHEEYTHFIICPDDLEVTSQAIEMLIQDVIEFNFETISGICNIDETQPDTYAIQPLGCDLTSEQPAVGYGAWYMKDNEPKLPNEDIIQVGHTGFACQMFSRSLLEKLSFVGATDQGRGNFDWQFSKDCHKSGVKIYVDSRIKLWHRRFEQYDRVQKFKSEPHNHIGYSFLLK